MTIHEEVKQWERHDGGNIFRGLGLPANASILDYGCGFGHYTLAVSRFLGQQGNVHAVDINKECLKHISGIVQEEGLLNIHTTCGNSDYVLDFPDHHFDMIMYYDILHGEGQHRFILYKEAFRTLKPGGVLSVLPFHLSNFRDRDGKKKTYTYAKIIKEITEYGFTEMDVKPTGVHFEKYHSKYYIDKGGVTFNQLETAPIINCRKINVNGDDPCGI